MFKIFKKSRILYHIVLGLFIIAMTTMAVCDTAMAAAGGNTLYPGESLARGQSLTSTDGRFVFTHQTDGNVVLYKQGAAIWHTHTYGQATTALVMQGDGNLVLYNGSSAVWHTYTWTSGPSNLVVQSDGNTVLYVTANNTASWSTGTWEVIAPAPEHIFGDANYDSVFDGAVTDMHMIERNDGVLFPVVYVNADKLSDVEVSEEAPFWWKLYMSQWKNGVHAEDRIPAGALYFGSSTTWWDWYDWATQATLGITPSGSLYTSSTMYEFSNRNNFYLCREGFAQVPKSGSSILGASLYNGHTCVGWGEALTGYNPSYRFKYVPGTYSFFQQHTGGEYHDTDDPAYSYMRIDIWIELFNKKILSPETSWYYEVADWEHIRAGETRKDGWGVLPMTEDPTQPPWIFFAPDSEELIVGEGTLSRAEGKTAEMWSPDMPMTIHIYNEDEIKASHFEDANEILALEYLLAYGGIDAADIDMNGVYTYIDDDGYTFENISLNELLSRVGSADFPPTVVVNGSGNTFEGGLDAAYRVHNETNGGPVIHVYMAQEISSWSYVGGMLHADIQYGDPFWDAENEYFKARLASALGALSGAGYQYDLVSHSWSGHLAGETLEGYMSDAQQSGLGTHFAINPAHGTFNNADQSWYNYLSNTNNNVKILAGRDDPVSQVGHGVGFAGYSHGRNSGVIGSDMVKSIDDSRGNILVEVINGAGHSIKDVIQYGGGGLFN